MKFFSGFAFSSQLFLLKDLANNYVDLHLSRTKMLESCTDNMCETTTKVIQDVPELFRTIPVKLPHKSGHENALVSPEDYDFLSSMQWRKSSSGYALSVRASTESQKEKTIYMHKLIFGKPAKHINGNRLDNRRENLASTNRTYKRKVRDDEEFDLKTHRVLSLDVHTYKQDDPSLSSVTGYGIVHFDNGKKYSGDIEKGIPHGFGVLSRNDKEKAYDMYGQWVYGKMDKGLVANFPPIPGCLCETPHICPFRNITNIQIIRNGRHCKD